jgi:taurine dioxygenase
VPAIRSITVERVSGAGGAVVHGVDLRAVDDDVVAALHGAIVEHHVLFFRGQRLTPEEQVAFSRRFGPSSPVPFVEPVADHPEVIAVVREASEAQRYTFGSIWHSDFSFLPEPPFASILQAIEVPPYGGDTIWANQELAHDALSRGMQQMLRGLRGVHSAVNAYSPKMQAVHDTFRGMRVSTSEDALRSETHPMVRVHPDSGRPSLFVNEQYTVGIADFRPQDAAPILQHLYAHATQDAFTFRWRWDVGDVAMWDNRCLQHLALADFTGHRRFMYRTTVAGSRPVAAP